MEVNICSTCNGTEKHEDLNQQIGRNDYKIVTCPTCNGTGRVYSTYVKLSLTIPYNGNKKPLYDFSTEMHEIHRKYQKQLRDKK